MSPFVVGPKPSKSYNLYAVSVNTASYLSVSLCSDPSSPPFSSLPHWSSPPFSSLSLSLSFVLSFLLFSHSPALSLPSPLSLTRSLPPFSSLLLSLSPLPPFSSLPHPYSPSFSSLSPSLSPSLLSLSLSLSLPPLSLSLSLLLSPSSCILEQWTEDIVSKSIVFCKGCPLLSGLV